VVSLNGKLQGIIIFEKGKNRSILPPSSLSGNIVVFEPAFVRPEEKHPENKMSSELYQIPPKVLEKELLNIAVPAFGIAPNSNGDGNYPSADDSANGGLAVESGLSGINSESGGDNGYGIELVGGPDELTEEYSTATPALPSEMSSDMHYDSHVHGTSSRPTASRDYDRKAVGGREMRVSMAVSADPHDHDAEEVNLSQNYYSCIFIPVSEEKVRIRLRPVTIPRNRYDG
jgi:hypothetical protein